MSELDVIRARAQRDLVLVTKSGLKDVRLWEHSNRVTETALKIAKLPGIGGTSVDETVLTVVGLYHDAGWITQWADGEVTREAICSKPTSSLQRDLAAVMMEASLKELLPPKTLEFAASCIRVLSDHKIDILESQFVAEADNLDEFGALYLWRLARKHTLEGKALEAAIKTWETQKQYGYWTARINDSFRFEPVKVIAHKRLQVFDDVIQQLKAHHLGLDLEEALTGMPLSASTLST